MKNLFTFFSVCLLYSAASAQTASAFYSFSDPDINGDTISMSQFTGQKLMVINCASFCAYTPEYAPLEQLYNEYHQYNFTIIGFPSNDFFNQGGTDSQIITTCNHYNVSFPIMGLVHVATSPVDPLFQWLTEKTLNGDSNSTVTWNFNKW